MGGTSKVARTSSASTDPGPGRGTTSGGVTARTCARMCSCASLTEIMGVIIPGRRRGTRVLRSRAMRAPCPECGCFYLDLAACPRCPARRAGAVRCPWPAARPGSGSRGRRSSWTTARVRARSSRGLMRRGRVGSRRGAPARSATVWVFTGGFFGVVYDRAVALVWGQTLGKMARRHPRGRCGTASPLPLRAPAVAPLRGFVLSVAVLGLGCALAALRADKSRAPRPHRRHARRAGQR